MGHRMPHRAPPTHSPWPRSRPSCPRISFESFYGFSNAARRLSSSGPSARPRDRWFSFVPPVTNAGRKARSCRTASRVGLPGVCEPCCFPSGSRHIIVVMHQWRMYVDHRHQGCRVTTGPLRDVCYTWCAYVTFGCSGLRGAEVSAEDARYRHTNISTRLQGVSLHTISVYSKAVPWLSSTAEAGVQLHLRMPLMLQYYTIKKIHES